MSRQRQSGFALLMVLMLVGLCSVMGVTYLRHVALTHEDSALARQSTDASDAVDSAVNWGRQVLRVSPGVSSATVGNGGRSASVQVADLDDGHGSILARAVDSSGIGSTSLLEVARRATPDTTGPATLPTIPPATLTSLLLDGSIPKTYLGGTQTISDTDYTGILVLEDGADITFDNVTLLGLLTTDRVVHGSPFDEFDPDEAPTARVAGNFRIDSGSFLSGVAVMLADGRFLSTGTAASLQITGDVLAHTLDFSGIGAIHGNLASVTPFSLDAQIDQPEAGRLPAAWSDQLEMGTMWDLDYVAWVPLISTAVDVTAITDFEWP